MSKDLSDTPHSLVANFKAQPKADTRTHVEKYAAAVRAEAETKIRHMQLAASVAEKIGYNLSQEPRAVNFLLDAIDQSSNINARVGGDAFKPYDPDMAYPTEDTLESALHEICRKHKIPKITVPEEPELKFA